LTYDITFLSAFAHNVTGVDVTVRNERCVAHPVTRRPVAGRTPLSDRLADVNVILAYYKLFDDVVDEGKGKIKSRFLRSAYKRAASREPAIDAVVKESYKDLTALERSGCDSVDAVADPFAEMLSKLSSLVLCDYATEFTKRLFYAVGKWLYLIDALDDYDKDVKKGGYNVLKSAYKSINAQNLVRKHGEDLNFIFGSLFVEVNECFNNIKFNFNCDLVGNILLKGLPAATQRIIKRINEDAGKRV
ncbi:MAG: hypothetical protein ILP02_04935, partial [Clostridia bacterium]|nr:hypothetical protein [Clostridia bacterium]